MNAASRRRIFNPQPRLIIDACVLSPPFRQATINELSGPANALFYHPSTFTEQEAFWFFYERALCFSKELYFFIYKSQEQITGHSRMSPVAVGEEMNQRQPMMETNGALIERATPVSELRLDVLAEALLQKIF